MIYPRPDPAHLCDCECHSEGNTVNYFTGCVCCLPCACGNHIKYEAEEAHRKSCVPGKDRHKQRS